jgi:hypothetical protein
LLCYGRISGPELKLKLKLLFDARPSKVDVQALHANFGAAHDCSHDEMQVRIERCHASADQCVFIQRVASIERLCRKGKSRRAYFPTAVLL